MKDGFRDWRCARGNASLLFAIAAIPLAVGAGAAIDFANAHSVRARLQAAADAAVLAGAAHIGKPAPFKEQRARESYSAQVSASLETIAFANAFTVSADATKVVLDAEAQVPTSLLQLVGIFNVAVGVNATASSLRRLPVCMLALDEAEADSIALQGNATLEGEDCAVQSNSTRDNAIKATGASHGEAEQFCSVGNFDSNGGGLSPAPQGNCPRLDDPLSGLAWPADGSCTMTNASFQNGTFDIGPGIYCGGLEARTHATLRLAPGTYVVKDGSFVSHAQSTVTGTDVTIFLMGTGARMNIAGGASIALSAPRTGPYAGLVIAQHPAANPGAVSVITGGGSIVFLGTLYMPTQTIELAGNGTLGADAAAWSLVAARFEMHGTPQIVIRSDFESVGYAGPLLRTNGTVALVD